jgi:hypothetical protein
MTTVEEWGEKSKRGEVCNILGCKDPPTTQCPSCHLHYCYQHMQNHGHILTEVEISAAAQTLQREVKSASISTRL